ncbi:DUF6882 domain-containing protein [Pontibacterium sp.]|uniref:DUF6882 domain-containing protein n=1 Tax=Pontibacterium sp. TaxID=2036026 RepID=UPI003569089C
MTDVFAKEEWCSTVSDACHFLTERQDALMRDYKLGEHQRFEWDQSSGVLTFSNNGVPAVRAKIQFVGSVSILSKTWLWSWANPSVDQTVKDQMEWVKGYGEERNFIALTNEQWEGDDDDGWEMTCVAALVLNAQGAYRTESETGYTYMIITDIQWVLN